MKLLFSMALLITSVQAALACSPAPYPYIYQSSQLNYILDSEKLSAELRRMGGERIEKIEMKDGAYRFILSSNCFVSAKVIYKSPSNPGLCPRMVDVAVESDCH